MAYILDIATAVPEYYIAKEDLINFYSGALKSINEDSVTRKLNVYSEKTRINNRYSCIPDFNGNESELFTDGNYNPPVEKRIELYKKKIIPLAVKAIDKLLKKTNIETNDITHIITVSCTGLTAPGIEFLVAEHYGLQNTEKTALNFLGCYAAIKALKHAHYISEAIPNACILIVSAELCSLHFRPSASDADMVANLLFADGAAAVLICGNESKYIKNKIALHIDAIGSAYIPGTLDLMTWNISSSAFRMYLDKNIVNTIKDNIYPIVNNFIGEYASRTDHWAIHPGGIRIVQAVRESLNLSESNVEDSISVLQQYGNMSSPTILFILNRILNKIKNDKPAGSKKIFSCAFGPGLSIEMIRLSSVDMSLTKKSKSSSSNYAIQV